MTTLEIFNYGVPTAVLLLILFGIWKTVAWMKTDIAEPVVKAHLELIQTLKNHLPKQTEAIDKQTEILSIIAGKQTERDKLLVMEAAKMANELVKDTAKQVAKELKSDSDK